MPMQLHPNRYAIYTSGLLQDSEEQYIHSLGLRIMERDAAQSSLMRSLGRMLVVEGNQPFDPMHSNVLKALRLHRTLAISGPYAGEGNTVYSLFLPVLTIGFFPDVPVEARQKILSDKRFKRVDREGDAARIYFDLDMGEGIHTIANELANNLAISYVSVETFGATYLSD